MVPVVCFCLCRGGNWGGESFSCSPHLQCWGKPQNLGLSLEFALHSAALLTGRGEKIFKKNTCKLLLVNTPPYCGPESVEAAMLWGWGETMFAEPLVPRAGPFLYPQRWAPGEVENAVQRGSKKPATIQKSGFSYQKKIVLGIAWGNLWR